MRSPIRTFLFTTCFLLLSSARAHEGMWLPTVLASIQDRMQAEGLKLSADDIYNANRSSLKDAIVLFGGGCTAEVISGQGLILTNHHCGFGAIAAHSSLENDYLKNGFWAAGLKDELLNEDLTATFIVRMEDVTAEVMAAIGSEADENKRKAIVASTGEAITKRSTEGSGHNGVVRAFNYGNQYILIVTETYRDVRLVGAPPGAIGKFGGDTDNWMWPRHTGDFSLFRVYTGPDGKPADPAPENVPMKPRHVLPISMDGVKEGDFAMIFGFPGNTQRYLTSYAVEHLVNTQDPLRIAMRDASLGVIDPAMRASDRTRIAYADKQSSISNGWKKWIGELRGLKELNTIEGKRTAEADYRARAEKAGRPELSAPLDEMKTIYQEWASLAVRRDLFVELVYNGPQLMEFAGRFKELLSDYDTLKANGKLAAELDRLRASADAHFKDFDADVDRGVFLAQWPVYRDRMPAGALPPAFATVDGRWKGNADAYIADLYARSVFASKQKLDVVLAKLNAGSVKKLKADPAYVLSQALFDDFLNNVRPRHAALSARIETAMRKYVAGMQTLYPERTFWPDANSTLRLSFGHVEGSLPRDGVAYTPFTTIDGIVAKYEPGDAEFDLPRRLLDLHRARDYGRYGANGTLPVCFTSSLHTTGGNSGSPVLNGRGELIGLNFDRTWESTMSDVQFDPAKCRNIAVDIRYVLFVIDKYAGATRLIEELELVSQASPAPTVTGEKATTP